MWLQSLIFWNLLYSSQQKSIQFPNCHVDSCFYKTAKLEVCMEKFYDSVYRKRYECSGKYDYLTVRRCCLAVLYFSASLVWCCLAEARYCLVNAMVLLSK